MDVQFVDLAVAVERGWGGAARQVKAPSLRQRRPRAPPRPGDARISPAAGGCRGRSKRRASRPPGPPAYSARAPRDTARTERDRRRDRRDDNDGDGDGARGRGRAWGRGRGARGGRAGRRGSDAGLLQK